MIYQPRDIARKLDNGSLKDLYTRLERRQERYWDILDPNVPIRPMPDVAPPVQEICAVPGQEASQEVIDCHLVPRMLQVEERGVRRAAESSYFIKNPNWIEPPPTARCVDLFTDFGVLLDFAFDIVTNNAQLFRFVVPDRHIAVFHSFGNEMGDTANWGDVNFELLINEARHHCYGLFTSQLGRFETPTRLRSPIILKHRDVIRMHATNTNNASLQTVWARLQGYMYAVRTVSDDGSFDKFRTL